MTRPAGRWIRWTTTGCVGLLALIAGTVSYLHMHVLVELHRQPGWVAALTPLSVDGMIVAASTTLLADSRAGERGGALPWALLVTGSVASLAANVAVAEPTATGRVIAAWPSFALIGSYELLMRQVRRAAGAGSCSQKLGSGRGPTGQVTARFSLARRSPASSVGVSAGVGWSSRLAWPERSQLTTKPPNDPSKINQHSYVASTGSRTAARSGGVSAAGGRQGYTGGVRVVQFGSLRRGRSKMAWNDTTSSTAEVVVV